MEAGSEDNFELVNRLKRGTGKFRELAGWKACATVTKSIAKVPGMSYFALKINP
jgi:hypothetical protein